MSSRHEFELELRDFNPSARSSITFLGLIGGVIIGMGTVQGWTIDNWIHKALSNARRKKAEMDLKIEKKKTQNRNMRNVFEMGKLR